MHACSIISHRFLCVTKSYMGQGDHFIKIEGSKNKIEQKKRFQLSSLGSVGMFICKERKRSGNKGLVLISLAAKMDVTVVIRDI